MGCSDASSLASESERLDSAERHFRKIAANAGLQFFSVRDSLALRLGGAKFALNVLKT